MGKWLWRFAQENSSLWKRVIAIKYGEDKGGWLSAEGSRNFGISLWKYIRRTWADFGNFTTWKVGRGDRILFWKHNWLEAGCLSTIFPELFAAASDKEALISDYFMGEGSNRTWNIQLRRNLNDWEIESYCYLLHLLHSLQLDCSEDNLLWKNSGNNCFTVKSFYSSLLGGEIDDFPWRKIWNSKAPSKVCFFSWCVARRRILTMDNLQRRGLSLVNRCNLCLCHEETIVHLFLQCTWSIELWSLTLSCFGVQWCFPNNIKEFLSAWWGQQLGKRRKKIWNLIPFCLFWLIWKERNRRTFDNIGGSILRAKSLFISRLFYWVEEGRELDPWSFIHFVDCLR